MRTEPHQAQRGKIQGDPASNQQGQTQDPVGDAHWWLDAHFMDRILRLSLLVGGGIALYFSALGLMGFRPRQFSRRAAE